MTATREVGASAPVHGSFHPLRVADVERITPDAVAITFEVPPALRSAYAYLPGQHLTLRAVLAGQEVRRSYSICTPPSSGRLQVAVKHLEGGVFSGHAHSDLRVGDVVDVMVPAGRFGVPLDAENAKHYAALVAGSGITPVLSIVSAVLECEPASRCTVVYGNRETASVMFLDDLADLKDRHPGRLQLLHVLSREPQDVELLTGRVDGAKLERLLATLLPVGTVDEWLLCGPYAMVEEVRSVLAAHGVPLRHVHLELFHVDGEQPRLVRRRAPGEAADSRVSVRLDGRRTTFAMPDEGSVLDALLAVRPDAPYSCKGGVCGTCRARLVTGRVEMARRYALDQSEVDDGYVLACQSTPLTPEVELDFDV